MKRVTILFLAACGGGVHSGPGAIDWHANVTTILADSFTANVEGVVFHGVANPDYKDLTGTGDIFEADWTEAGYMQRFHLDFTMKAPGWCLTSFRIYNLAYDNWHERTGDMFCTPLGSAYQGNVDVVMNDGTRVTLPNATIEAFGSP